MTKRQYIEYLISTPANYTCSNLAAHLVGIRHDALSDYLARQKFTARHLWELVQPLLQDGLPTYLIVDDSVQAKPYARKIELVKTQYSGATHGLVAGSGVVNLVHSDGQDYYPIDYRIYAPAADGKTKHQHFQAMLIRAVGEKAIQSRYVLFDSWYASADTLKLIVRRGRSFVTTLKANRMVSLSRETGYVHLAAIAWTPEQLQHGIAGKTQRSTVQSAVIQGGRPRTATLNG